MFNSLTKKQKYPEVGHDIATPVGRRQAHYYFLMQDHGLLRLLWGNMHEVCPHIWRSNHPSIRRLQKFKRMGIQSVLNLRGENSLSPYLFENETCEAIGLNLINLSLTARHLPPAKTLLTLLDHFETLPQPFVMHCKSGADRTGLAAAFYLLHIKNIPVTIAKKQLSVRYLHFRLSKSGILDHMLDSYEKDVATTAMPIRTWIETCYDPIKLTAEFENIEVRH